MNSDGRWEHRALGEVLTLKRGYDLPARERRGGGVPIISSSGLSGYHDAAKVKAPGVVTGRYGTIGEIFYVEQDFWPLNTALYVEDFRGNDPRYCAELLRSVDFNAYNSKSGVPGINRNDLHTAEVLVAPLAEQQVIAGIAAAIDYRIDSNRRLTGLLEAVVSTMFRAQFVDFVGEASFVESELGSIPQGWAVAAIGDVLEVVGGSTPSTKEPQYWDGGMHCWSTPKDLAGAYSPVLLNTRRHITDEGLSQISSKLLPKRTVLLSSRAPVGYTAMSMVEISVNQGFIAIPPSDSMPSEYVLFWLRANMERIKAHAGGTTFAEISKRAFRPMLMAVPPVSLLTGFEQVARPVIDRITAQERESRTLSQIRDALLPRLISGEIRIPDTADPGEVIGAVTEK